MNKVPDWNKRGTIATWVTGGIMISLVVFGYFKPQDVNHPVTLDFLSQSVSEPIWLAVFLPLGAMLLTWAVARWVNASGRIREPKALPIAQFRTQEIVGLDTATTPSRQRSSAMPLALGRSDEYLHTVRDHLGIKVFRQDDGLGNKGLGIHVINKRRTAIGWNQISITSVRSFLEDHLDFSDGYGFKPVIRANNGPILAGSAGPTMWLIHKHSGIDNLVLGESTGDQIIWHDDSDIRRWLFSIIIRAREVASANQQGVDIQPLTVEIIVEWARRTNEFAVRSRNAPVVEACGPPPESPRLTIDYFFEEERPLLPKSNRNSDPNSQLVIRNLSQSQSAFNARLLPLKISGSLEATFDPKIITTIPPRESANVFAHIEEFGAMQKKSFAEFVRKSYESQESEISEQIVDKAFSLTVEYEAGLPSIIAADCELIYNPFLNRITTGRVVHRLAARA